MPMFALGFGLWETIAMVAAIVILFFAKVFPEIDRFREPGPGEPRWFSEEMDDWILWIAQGFDLGKIPKAPGTLGSLVGIVLFLMLLSLGSFWLFIAGAIICARLSVAICGRAEQLLKAKDPGSIVFDEIIAIPICFITWILIVAADTGQFPSAHYFFEAERYWGVVGIFLAFRFFDIAKPWPVFQAQSLPGGWGVTMDDVVAALYVNLVTWVVWVIFG